MKKLIILFVFILLGANQLLAQKLTIQTSSTNVAVGEPFQVTFSINGTGAEMKVAHLNEFDVIQGPYNSSSMQVMNGVVTQSYSATYVISGRKEGKYTLGPATIVVNGNTIQSNTVAITVSKAGTNTNSGGQSSAGHPTKPEGDNNVFISAITSKSKVYVGEEITLNYKLYFRVDVENYLVSKLPAMDGCFVQEEPINPSATRQEIIDGKQYTVADIKKTYVIPQRSGKITIDPMEGDFVIRQPSTRRPQNIWDQMMGGGYEEVKVKLRSKPVVIDVLPLPEEKKPEGFAGAVGNFSFKASLSKDKVKANDAINLTITLSGKGNLKLIDPPKVNFPEDFETYDPKVTQNLTTTNGLGGSKTFDYLIIPRHEGDYKIDNLNFSYFDPVKKEYVTLPSPEFNIHVDKGDPNDVNASVYTPRSKEDIKVLGDDIRYINTKTPDFTPSDNYFFNSAAFWTGILLPLIGFVAFYFVRKKNIEMNSDAIAVKGRKATKMARKRLTIAEHNLKASNKEQFYIEISHALYGYVSDKLNISVANLTKENISNTLKQKGAKDSTIEQLMATINTCEYARYAPNAVSGDLQTIYNDTVKLITTLENEIK
ncbi:MAG TPA: BatD family protein [Bacteroidia bacterium]|jgi:hypothetical protein|nr:BatD family protein [Bacteroidia bacterium]